MPVLNNNGEPKGDDQGLGAYLGSGRTRYRKNCYTNTDTSVCRYMFASILDYRVGSTLGSCPVESKNLAAECFNNCAKDLHYAADYFDKCTNQVCHSGEQGGYLLWFWDCGQDVPTTVILP